MNIMKLSLSSIIGCGILLAAIPHALAAEPGKRALLVGCTFYEHLDKGLHLEGPGNDVLLMQKLLTERFGFHPDNIVILAESAGKDRLPTRKNIEQQFQRLIRITRPGDQVVILMAGHGSQQPQKQPVAPEDFEADGLDELFLPRDVGRWDGAKGMVVNAIVDKELRDWLKPFAQKNVSVWVIVDACHSGGMIRGNEEEKLRQVPADLLVPRAELDRAVKLAAEQLAKSPEKTRGGAAPSPRVPPQAPALVALYASQSTEPTVEKRLPADSPDRKPYGLLTFTVNQILTRSTTPLTYRELAQRVHAQYVNLGRSFPTPLIEGKDQDREVLGVQDWPGRSRIALSKGEDGWKINAGAVHGLTEGTILAVYPPAGQGDKPVGHVRVSELDTFSAAVEPCPYNGQPARKELPVGGRGEPVYVDLGIQRLKVAVDAKDGAGKPIGDADRQRLEHELAGLAKDLRSLVRMVSNPAAADWLVRWQSGRAVLVPAAGWVKGKDDPQPPVFGPLAIDAKLGARLQDHFGRIARVENLKKLASSAMAETLRGTNGVKVEVEVRLLRSRTDKEGQPVVWGKDGLTFHDGDRLEFRLRNPNRFAIDVTLLYIDSGFGIDCLFPERGEINRLGPKEMQPARIRVDSKTRGLEHMVVLAVRAVGQPVDFACLKQPTLERARQDESVRGGPQSRLLDSPLGKLLQNALYGEGTTRGAARDALDENTLMLLSWHILPGKRAGDQK
jgi:Caspase domain